MVALEKLFRLEVQFHRQLRSVVPHDPDTGGLHTSYALQCGYELLLRSIGSVTAADIDSLGDRLLLIADPRDVHAARDCVSQLFGLALPPAPSLRRPESVARCAPMTLGSASSGWAKT